MLKGPFITLDRIAIRVRQRRLFAGTTWTIGADQHWVVIGPNGAGKSSLVRALSGQVPVVEGKIYYHEPGLGPQAIGYISFETQRNLIAREEAREDVRHFSGDDLEHRSVRQMLVSTIPDTPPHAAVFKSVVDRLDIAELLERPLLGLSTGEIRRVLLARELLPSPRLLILDEPYDGLDSGGRRRLQAIMTTLAAQSVRMILVTHHPEEIPPFATHILAVESGRVAFQGTRASIRSLRRLEGFFDPKEAERRSPSAPPPFRKDRQTMAGKELVDMRNVCVNYAGKTVIKDLSWTMRAGENWAILGPNGSGKTTLLNLISGDHPQAYANSIRLFGRRKGSGESIWDVKRRIGLISSEFQIRYRKSLTAFDVVLSGFFDSVGLYRRASKYQVRCARAWMNYLGCAELGPRSFMHLSQGEQRLLLVVRAVVKQPLLLILDEPCQGLDHAARYRLLGLCDRMGNETGIHLIYVTHHPEEIPDCITHVLLLEKSAKGGCRVLPGTPGGRN